MNKVLFEIKNSIAGGIERLAIDSMNHFANDINFQYVLVIQNNNGNFVQNQLKKQSEIYYLQSQEFMLLFNEVKDKKNKYKPYSHYIHIHTHTHTHTHQIC